MLYIFLGAMKSIIIYGVNIIYYTENVWGQFLFILLLIKMH